MEQDVQERNKVCSICLDQFEPDSEVRLTPCNHIFHDACLAHWVDTSHKVENDEISVSCPYCMNPIATT